VAARAVRGRNPPNASSCRSRVAKALGISEEEASCGPSASWRHRSPTGAEVAQEQAPPPPAPSSSLPGASTCCSTAAASTGAGCRSR